MAVKTFQLFRPDGSVDSAELRRLAKTVEAQDRITGSNGLTVDRNGAGFQIGQHLPITFWARITDDDGGDPAAHSWIQQRELPDGTLEDDPDGKEGDLAVYPAYSIDGSAVPADTLVRLFLAVGGEYYLFQVGGEACMGLSVVKTVVVNVTCEMDTLVVTTEMWTFECGKLVAVES